MLKNILKKYQIQATLTTAQIYRKLHAKQNA